MTDSAGETVIEKKRLARCPVFRIDLKGRFVNVDDLTEKFFGQPTEYYFGKNISDFLDESSRAVIEDVLCTGRHFETFFKSVNLTFIDSKETPHEVGAVISLNFIGGNPANYQFVLTSAFPARIGELLDEEESESSLERISRYIYDLDGPIDWNSISDLICKGDEIVQAGIYLYDEGRLSLLGEASRQGIEPGMEPSDINDRLIDVAAKKQPLIPAGDTPGDRFEYAFPLSGGERVWGVMRIFSESSGQDVFDNYNIISGIIGKSLSSYVAERWEEKRQKELLLGSFRSFINDLNCTFFSFNREGKLSHQFGRFTEKDSPLAVSDSIHQVFGIDTGFQISDVLCEDKLLFAYEGGSFEIPKEAIVQYRGESRYMKILAVPKEFQIDFEYIALVFPGMKSDSVSDGDLELIDSIIAASSIFIESINKNAVLLSANSYRQLGKDGRGRLNAIQDKCKDHSESLKRIKAQARLINRNAEKSDIDFVKMIEKCSLSAGISGRETPLYEFGQFVDIHSDGEVLSETLRSVFANIASAGFGKDDPPLKISSSKTENGFEIAVNCRLNISDPAVKPVLPFYERTNGFDDAAPGLEYAIITRLLKPQGGKMVVNREQNGYTIKLTFS